MTKPNASSPSRAVDGGGEYEREGDSDLLERIAIGMPHDMECNASDTEPCDCGRDADLTTLRKRLTASPSAPSREGDISDTERLNEIQPLLKELVWRWAQSGRKTSEGALVVLNDDEANAITVMLEGRPAALYTSSHRWTGLKGTGE